MKFAKFWARHELHLPKNKLGCSTIGVWGASNQSVDAAHEVAKFRSEKFKKYLAGSKQEYDYFNEYIKEELIEEVRDSAGELIAAISRNKYGALVLNTEQVLFGDIDVPVAAIRNKLRVLFGLKKQDKQFYLERIKKFQKIHSDYIFRVYETFGGLRFIVENKIIRPDSEELKIFFNELKVDRLYTKLCSSQRCFRARLTPKPWRIGLEDPRLKYPRPENKESEFQTWLNQYQSLSRDKIVARYLTTYGRGHADPVVRVVLELHDRYIGDDPAKLA